MLQAIFKGKLSREQENMEDVLTSNVFGLLRYVEPENGILKFLSLAEDIDGGHPLSGLAEQGDIVQQDITYTFWPWWDEPNCNGCEPDVVLELNYSSGKSLLILIEAKYLSGKSSEADPEAQLVTDQLAREWVNLRSISKREGRTPILIYLTGGTGFPRGDIDNACKELNKKVPDSIPSIYWLSWRHLYSICTDTDNLMLRDLKALLDRLGMRFFNGWGFSYQPGTSNWKFGNLPKKFNWQVNTNYFKSPWRYHQ